MDIRRFEEESSVSSRIGGRATDIETEGDEAADELMSCSRQFSEQYGLRSF